MKQTYRSVIDFVNNAGAYVQAHPEENKLKYALQKVQKKALKMLQAYNDSLEDLRVENCATDEKGVVLRDPNGNYQFTKEGLTAFNKAQRAFITTGTVDIDAYIVTELPENFEEGFREVFTGFVL